MSKFSTAMAKLDDKWNEIEALDSNDEALKLKHQECGKKLEELKNFQSGFKVDIAKVKYYLKDIENGKKADLID